jgi:hypothetical protein
MFYALENNKVAEPSLFFTAPVTIWDKLRYRFLLLLSYGSGSAPQENNNKKWTTLRSRQLHDVFLTNF